MVSNNKAYEQPVEKTQTPLSSSLLRLFLRLQLLRINRTASKEPLETRITAVSPSKRNTVALLNA